MQAAPMSTASAPEGLSFASADPASPWRVYLEQIERVLDAHRIRGLYP